MVMTVSAIVHPTSAGTLPAARLFELLRADVVDAIGTTCVAVLIRRAVDRASRASQRDVGLVVAREGLGYRYHLPESWSDADDAQARVDLAALVKELLPLVGELSGATVVRRIVQIPPLRSHGIVSMEDVARWSTT